MSTRSDYIGAINDLVPGEHSLEASDLEQLKIRAVSRAMELHSRHKAQLIVEDIDGDGGFDYALSGLALWTEGFSVIRQVEYPVDDGDKMPNILPGDEWVIYEKPSGKMLRFLEATPETEESLRIRFTAPHTCTAAGCTVAAKDEGAVQSLAAHFFCKMLVSAYALDQNSTIDADVVDHGGRSARFEALGKQYLAEYNDQMGIVPGMQKAASVTADQDNNASWAGDRLTHSRKSR